MKLFSVNNCLFCEGSFFCGYEIPVELTHLWRYIKEMYQLDAFTQSNPADQVEFQCTPLLIR